MIRDQITIIVMNMCMISVFKINMIEMTVHELLKEVYIDIPQTGRLKINSEFSPNHYSFLRDHLFISICICCKDISD